MRFAKAKLFREQSGSDVREASFYDFTNEIFCGSQLIKKEISTSS